MAFSPLRGDGGASAVVVDARCLQDAEYAGRGVGRHALALLAGFPREDGHGLVALTDLALPPIDPAVAGMFAAVAMTPYAAAHAARRLAAFVSLSPMTHDPLFTARFLGGAAAPATAVVYDFIPMRHSGRYLKGITAPLGYALSLYWLGRFDRFAPISQSTADDLAGLLRPRAEGVRVTGAAVAERFAGPRAEGTAPRSGVLVVGGDDPRKDPQTVVRAHARSAAMQSSRTVLTVAGNYAAWHHGPLFGSLAASEGGDPALVHVPGHLSDEDLLDLYRAAATVVCPSVDEGFSLPLVEGMAAGAVVYASDIPAHRELVPDPARLFPPGDAGRLAAILDAGHADPARTAAVLDAQAEVWPRFRAGHVAGRFWSHAMAGVAPCRAAPAVLRRAKPRIAVLTPLPPDRSGVADYTAATCAELARLAALDVFTETRSPVPIPGVARVLPLSDLPGTTAAYDRTVHVVGNSEFHNGIFDRLRRFGGACIAHDARMLGFYALRVGSTGVAALASRELGRRVPVADAAGWIDDERDMPTPLLSEVAEASSPMIVHSPVTHALLRERLGVETVLLPFCIYRAFAEAELAPNEREAARARLGIPTGEAVIATFGFVDGVKAPMDCLWALESLRRWGVDASMHFVGRYDERDGMLPSLPGLAAELGVARHVRFFPAFTDERTFRDYLLAADVAVQLRTYGHGGLSGAVLDCAAAGLPVVGNAGLIGAVAPPPGLSRAVPDTISPVLLAEAVMEQLAAGRGSATANEERRAFVAERSFTRYARMLMTALELA